METKHIYLKIDSQETDYQPIHLDVKNQYGILCKFKFDVLTPNEFEITHIKSLAIGSFGVLEEFQVNILKTCDEDRSPGIDYGYKIILELTTLKGNTDDYFKVIKNGTQHKFTKKTGAILHKIYRIDTHIDEKPNEPKVVHNLKEELNIEKNNFLSKNIDFGTEFCRFYVV